MFPWFQNLDDEDIHIPDELPILPLRNTVAFPFALLPLSVGIPRSVQLVEETEEREGLIGLVAMHDPSIEVPGPGEVYEIGTVAQIHRVMPGGEGDALQVIIQGIERFRIKEWVQEEPYLVAGIESSPEKTEEPSVELDALRRNLIAMAGRLAELMPQLPDEVVDFLDQIEDPRLLIYLVAANLRMDVESGQELLEIDDVGEKMRTLINILSHELEVMELGEQIRSEAQSEMEKTQREYFLREQLKAIRRELGEEDEQQIEIEEYREKIAETAMSEEGERQALRELSRMEKMPPQAAEYSVIKTYLDWLVELPWGETTDDNLDIQNARKVLNEDHYDLEEIKDRILEFLAVRKLRKDRDVDMEKIAEEVGQGTIVCFIGPPGTGKTSLGRSIARALGREFTRMSLGGMRDEAEIRGHRRTYIGAMPGRIIQAVKRVGTMNPVFMLDEVDKIGADWRGDPSSALLEVLDPQQNNTFRDHYLDVDFDLSQVMFICTGNLLEPIPAPLRDRMEIIKLDGYTEYDKVHIARDYLIPRQVLANGLEEDEIEFVEEGIRQIIRDYTREAGVRNLEREIGRVCRKVATQVAAGEIEDNVVINGERAKEFLGKRKFYFEAAERTEIPGVATALAVTPTGGEVLFVEATEMPGQKELTLTGQLGEVMQESARIGLSYVRSKTDHLGVDRDFFKENDIHLHVPAGATPKDGPSAGVAMVTAITSLLTEQPVRADVGMTGEITLRGQVMPIGGVKQKVLAAHRGGLKTVILPQRNEADLDELPSEVREAMKFVLVENIDQALKNALREPEEEVEKEHPLEQVVA